jgi:hypothetical protein
LPLKREEWIALEAFADDDIEPLEQVFFALRAEDVMLAPTQFLALMFGLFREGFVSIQQSPIMGQEFIERAILPATPAAIVGDLGADFAEFYSRGEYLRQYDGGGVPFGIYFLLTESGRVEKDKPEYALFYPAEGTEQ